MQLKRNLKYPFSAAVLMLLSLASLAFQESHAEENPAEEKPAAQVELKSFANEATRLLETAAPEKTDSQTLSRIWLQLSKKIDESFLSLIPANRKLSDYQSPANLEKARLQSLLLKMQETGRIRLMTPETEAALGIDKYLCRDTQPCKEIRAFYVPLTHHIVLRKSLDDQQMVDSLYHELVHAAQFTYRFPLDIKTLSTLKIPSDELLDFIDFYYESQANYRTLRLSQPQEWESLFRSSETSYIGASVLTTIVCPFCLAVTTVHRGYSRYKALSYLPEIDINSEPGWHKPTGGKESALYLSELLLLKDSDSTPFTGTGWDTQFHQRFGKAIERTYFGKLPFLFQNDRKDQEAYKALHDAYYKNIGVNNELELDPRCSSLIEQAQQKDTSPLVSWLTLPQSDIESCKAFNSPGTLGYRDVFISELLRKIENQNSPFIVIRPGSEGTKPNLKVTPSLRVLPQLRVSP